MHYRTLGNTGLSVSEICYGTMRYASKQGVHDEQSKAATRALEQAVDEGINFIHSSYEYGTRWLTGEVLGKHPKRHELHHIIKVNVPEWGEPEFDPAVFRTQVENALRELKVDHIAVVQHLQRGTLPRELGYCAEGEPQRLSEFDSFTDSLVDIFNTMRDEGKVGYLASFPYTQGYAKKAVESGKFSCMVSYFDALETEMVDLFPAMNKAGMGFIGIRPLAAGLLTDRRINRESLPKDDRMRDSQFDRFYDQLAELRSALPEEPESWTRFAIQFSLIHPMVSSVVAGINTPEQLRTIMDAANGDYPDRSILETAHKICTTYRSRFGVKATPGGVPCY